MKALTKSFHTKQGVILKGISFLIPFLALFLLEAGLRIFRYGHDLSLFIEYPPDHRYLVLNPDAAKRYFSDPSLAPSGNSEPFKKEKDKNTCRIFVLGESTTIGYPYFHNGSFHRWLQYRLMRSFTMRSFEIINLSMTAVNSYTVRGFAKELVNYEPDAVLIYSGQNEYYGAMGVGSTNSFSGNPTLIQTILYLRQLRITQLLRNTLRGLAGLFSSGKAQSGGTLMQKMAGDQQIPFGSKLYYRGIGQYQSNMEKVLQLFNEHRVPVFISNLVSNEKDLPPFVSIEGDSAKLPAFKGNYELGRKAMESGKMKAAYEYFIAANRQYGGHALCNYRLGQLTDRQGDYLQAEAWFSKARDLDGLRFRAPAELNEVIARLCGKYPNSHLVDTRAEFKACSDHHIIGGKLILEHVHPNLQGYALMSDAFYVTLQKAGIVPRDKERELTLSQLEAEMPITLVDSLTGVYRIAKLKMSWPFRADRSSSEAAGKPDSLSISTEEEKLAYGLAFDHARWAESMEQLYDYYIRDFNLLKAGSVMEAKALEYPFQPGYYERAANVYGKLNDFEHAVFYFKKAFALSPSFEQARVLFVLYLHLDRPIDAMPYIDYAFSNGSDPRLGLVRKNTEEIIRLQRDLAKDTGNTTLLNQIADRYYGMGNREGAIKYLEKTVRADPGNRHALVMLGRLRASTAE